MRFPSNWPTRMARRLAEADAPFVVTEAHYNNLSSSPLIRHAGVNRRPGRAFLGPGFRRGDEGYSHLASGRRRRMRLAVELGQLRADVAEEDLDRHGHGDVP